MTSWLEVLLNFLREFVPLRVIREGFHGVRFVRGHARGPYPPNWYWSVPLFYEMESYPTAEQVVNLTNVSCTTADDCSITLSANFNYLVENAVLAYTRVHDVDQSMATEALKYINRIVRKVERKRLLEDQADLERRMMRHLQGKVEDWGIRMVDFGLTDVTEATPLRHFGEIGR